MSVILVADRDASFGRQIVSALKSEGWTATLVGSRAAALESAAAEMPSLVLASSTMPEAEHLLGTFSRARGGPGAVVMVPSGTAGGISPADYQADDMLNTPCSDDDLLQVVRQCLAVSTPPTAEPKRSTKQMTSAEIFGDVLAEVEAEAKQAKKARQKRTQSRQSSEADIEKRLAETLSGVLSVDELRKRSKKQAAAAAARDRAEVDKLVADSLGAATAPKAAPAAEPAPAAAPELPTSEPPAPERPVFEPPKVSSFVSEPQAPKPPAPVDVSPEAPVPEAPAPEMPEFELSDAEPDSAAQPDFVEPDFVEPSFSESPAEEAEIDAAPMAPPELDLPDIELIEEPADTPSESAATGSSALPRLELPDFEETEIEEERIDVPSTSTPETSSVEPPPTQAFDFALPPPPISVTEPETPSPTQSASDDSPVKSFLEASSEPADLEPASPAPAAPESAPLDAGPPPTSFEDAWKPPTEPAKPLQSAAESTDFGTGGGLSDVRSPATPADQSPGERDGEIFVTQPFPVIAPGSTERSTTELPGLDVLAAARKAADDQAAAKDSADGETFGDYTLLDRIAVGGMAEVWRARRRGVEGFQKIVAIKKILAHLTDSADFVTMLIDEAKLAAQLNHHNIIQIYDLGKVGEDFFIAMEYVEGKDLRSILEVAQEKSQPLPIGMTLLVIDAVARALDYAHRKRDFEDRELGLVHRDISPQNVLISYEGEIKLCDFGIVKAVSKASTTQMGALKGKLQYMSPEQAWGRSVDARSDIFSLGSVFFELLTGTKLFTGDSEISVLDAVRECRPRSPRELVSSIPKEVESIVLKALAKNPDDRYQRAGDMEHDIKSVLDLIKPTPGLKDLSSYMDTLFRQPAAPVLSSPAAVATPPAAVTTPAMADTSSAGPVTGTGTPEHPVAVAPPATDASKVVAPAEKSKAKSSGDNRLVKMLAAAVVVGVLAGAGYLFLLGPLAPGQGAAGPASPPATVGGPPAVTETGENEGAEVPPGETTEGAEGAEGDPEAAEGAGVSGPVAGDPAAGDPAAAEEAKSTDAEGAADEDATAEDGALDLEQLVAEEVSKRREEMERDFEERKRRLEEEIEKTKKASDEDDSADGEGQQDGGDNGK